VELKVNGADSDTAARGDLLTFPFDGVLKPGDKLYKIVKA